MYTLMNSDAINNISYLMNQHIELFNSFTNIYLFGSVLNTEKAPNDIDILLIYSEYSNTIMKDLDIISSMFIKLNKLPTDLTVLSVEEEENTKFLKRLNSKYLKLK